MPATLADASESVTTTPNDPVTTNVLASTRLPPGTTASVVGFTLQGSSTVYTPSSTPVPVTDPVTGVFTGSIEVAPDGTVTFTPAPGYIGPVPAVTYTVASSDGQINRSTLTIDVVNSKSLQKKHFLHGCP